MLTIPRSLIILQQTLDSLQALTCALVYFLIGLLNDLLKIWFILSKWSRNNFSSIIFLFKLIAKSVSWVSQCFQKLSLPIMFDKHKQMHLHHAFYNAHTCKLIILYKKYMDTFIINNKITVGVNQLFYISHLYHSLLFLTTELIYFWYRMTVIVNGRLKTILFYFQDSLIKPYIYSTRCK